ncbi:LmbE family N-acetylglucosaminyl deacetylase OS=Castellaniella defragrans OX=75697 GN=HNR28_000385 PE=4 SV=1 [Castellaniella defragrans]
MTEYFLFRSLTWSRAVLVCLCLVAPAGALAAPLTAGCHLGTVLAVVAHTDDDLLFMNPDQDNSIRDGLCMRVVYMTAGDRGEGLPYLREREHGIMAAYADMAHVADLWTTDGMRVEGRTLVRHTLLDNPRIQLIMLRLPDPWLGPGWGSLTPLSRVESVPDTNVESYGPYRETYTRSQLVALLAALIETEHPQEVRMMDTTIKTAYQSLCWRCEGHDHPDHIASAHLTEDATAAVPGLYARVAYLDYPSQERPANLDEAQADRKTAIFLRYMRDDPHYCPDPAQCSEVRGPEAKWVERQYTVSNSRLTATTAAR